MKHFNSLLLAAICLCSYQFSNAQLCDGNKGPNLLGARGTFSIPFITPNTNADACLTSGTNTYNPPGNVGNKLEGCSNPSGNIIPCSDYNYTAVTNGMQPEFTYSILKVMGDQNGSNCIHSPVWKGKNHTPGDEGYFLAVNGAPDVLHSPIFYQIKSIPVCIGATYEFSAWVINMFPGTGTNSSSPNISFVVNGTDTIGKSGPIPMGVGWVQVGGSFVATTDHVDLKVINATAVAGGNDLGLDDISMNVCQSRIVVQGPLNTCEGNTIFPTFTVTDPTSTNTFYKWQVSRDGSISFQDLSEGTLTYTNGTATLSYGITNITPDPSGKNANGNIYRLVVATTEANLSNPDCIYFNDYVLQVSSACGQLPLQLTSFGGTYSNGIASLNWKTSQELNSDHFELFSSFDGNNFSPVSTIKASGYSSVVKNYQFNDKVIGNASNYIFYKLKQVDKDGRSSFSNVIKLSLGDTKSFFQLFPNPVINDFTASFSASKLGTATLLIRSSNGQTIYSKIIDVQKGNNSVLVNSPQLKTGIYYVSIVNDDINYTGKLQKQ